MNRFKTFFNKEFKRKKISQNKFAELLGISSFYLGQILKGEKSPPDRNLQVKIADELNLKDVKKNEYFNLIAKEKNDIPTDIYNQIIDNPNKWNDIRKILNEEIKK